MTYEEQLKDPRWIAVSRKIKERDFGICQRCMSSKNLQVHHIRYIDGRMAWEYDSIDLLTLCEVCHKIEHGITDEVVKDDYAEAWRRVKRDINILRNG